MAYVRRHWADYPSTETPIDADALNNIEDGIEESHNIQLLAVTDTAPSECADGDKYYNTTTGLIYTATGTDTWGETGETPIYDILYIVLDEQTTYTYNGTNLVSVGGGSSTGGGETLKIGTILPFSGSTLPTGYLFCDGSAISRTTYAGLFAVIGTAFGAGDGSTTFNLPNLNGKVPVGKDSNDTDFDTLGETGGSKFLQNHVHYMGKLAGRGSDTSWGFPSEQNTNMGDIYTQTPVDTYGNAITTGDSGNLQPYLVVNYIIKATQTTPVQAQIINEYSESTTDAYSANYINQIIESGTDYIKYYDGTMICYGAVNIQASESRSAGGLTYYSGYSEIDLSEPFISTEIYMFATAGIANMNIFASTYCSVDSVSHIRVSYACTTKNDTRRISYFAIGKWK